MMSFTSLVSDQDDRRLYDTRTYVSSLFFYTDVCSRTCMFHILIGFGRVCIFLSPSVTKCCEVSWSVMKCHKDVMRRHDVDHDVAQ